MSSDANDEPRTLAELISGTPPVAMVMTMFDGAHTSRPVTIADIDGNRLSFLVSRNAEWVQAVDQQMAAVHLTITNDSHSTYLSLNGSAFVTGDLALREQLWSAPAGAWFTGPDDPDLAVFQFDVDEGRYWDGPDGRLGRGLALLRAAITGSDQQMGTYGQVQLDAEANGGPASS